MGAMVMVELGVGKLKMESQFFEPHVLVKFLSLDQNLIIEVWEVIDFLFDSYFLQVFVFLDLILYHDFQYVS